MSRDPLIKIPFLSLVRKSRKRHDDRGKFIYENIVMGSIRRCALDRFILIGRILVFPCKLEFIFPQGQCFGSAKLLVVGPLQDALHIFYNLPLHIPRRAEKTDRRKRQISDNGYHAHIVASIFDVSLDLTPNRVYSLSKTTSDYLSGLDEKVDFYILADLDEIKLDTELLALSSMLDEYREYDCINFKDIDPDKNPDIIDELNPDGYLNLTKGDIVVKCGENAKRIPGNVMYYFETDENNTTQNAYFQGENYITGAIKSVVEGIMPSVYFLTGHGEKSLDENYTTFRKNLKNYNYDAKELNLVTEDAVPEDAKIIIVAAPQTDITEAEKAKLESFMEKGGNLSLLMSPNDADIDYTNIEDIMNQYGIGMDYNIVSETDSSKHVSGDDTTIMVNLVDVSETDDKSITDLTSPLISGDSITPFMTASRSFFEYQGENRSDLTICPLIETYDSAIGKPYGGTEADPDEIAGILYLAAYSENIINDSKLVVMGNANFIDDQNLEDGYEIIPLNLYLSTITWMYNSDIDMGIASKIRTYDYMELKSKEDTNFVLITLYAAPVIVAAAGLLIWLKRRHS